MLFTELLKLINNSLCLNKGNQDRDGVCISDLNYHRFLRFYLSVFSLVLVSIENSSNTQENVRLHSKHLASSLKTLAHHISSPLLSVWKCSQTQSFVFDILRNLSTNA